MNVLYQALPARGNSASASASFTAEQPNQIPLERRHIVHPQQHPLSLHPLNWQYMRPKQVTDPLNEAVRAKLITSCPDEAEHDYSTSGSDHDMRFLEEDHVCADSSQDNKTDADSPAAQLFLEEQLRDILERVCSTVQLEVAVLRDIRKALGMEYASNVALSAQEKSHAKTSLRRFVVRNLRYAGYNAGICKSRWEQTNGSPAGEYEVIDVVAIKEDCSGGNHRILVDIDFRAQFEIARPTAEYARLVDQIPPLFVGDKDKLHDIIRTMCDAAKLSLRAKGMQLPPWRKYRYVAAKWLGPYKRTTNAEASACNCVDERRLLVRQSSGVVTFKGLRCHWDAAFIHQLELHFGKAVREPKRNLKSQGQPKHEQASRNGLILSDDKSKSKRKSRLNEVRTSGLAAALAEATAHTDGDTCINHSHLCNLQWSKYILLIS